MKKIVMVTVVLLSAVWMSGQEKDMVLFTVGGEPVYAGEFVYQYLKNNTGVKDSLPVDQYLDLYVNFKLKVKEAKDLGYDTVSRFRKEYYEYLMQVAEPYFKSKKVQDSLVNLYYNKLQKQVRFSYIVIPIPKGSDTSQVYNMMLDIRKQALNGTPFEDLVKRYSVSRSKDYDNGDVGYVTVFDIPPAFEPFLFDTGKPGDISMPVKFMNLYYLMKITDITGNQGRVKVEHILLAFPKGGPKTDSLAAINKAREIQQKLATGSKFEDLAREYSDDYRTAKNGGLIGWIKPGQTLPEFQEAAFALQNPGDVAGPVRTAAGWEFIKLVDKKQIGSKKDEEPYILEKLKHRPAYRLISSYVIDSLKKAYNFKMTGSLEAFYKLPDTLLNTVWKPDMFGNKPLFELNGKVYTEHDFAAFLSAYPHMGFKSVKDLIDSEFEHYLTYVIKQNYIDYLAANDKDFGRLAKEFYEGLLLFNISNQNVWSKAQKDTAGLRNFYLQRRNKYYQKLKIVVFEPKNKKYKKQLIKILKKSPAVDTAFLASLDSTKYKVVFNGVVSEDNPQGFGGLFDIFKEGKVKPNQKVIILSDGKVVYLEDNFRLVSGLVMADYQDYLEQEWVEDLHKKYKVSVDDKVKQQVENQIKQQRKQ